MPATQAATRPVALRGDPSALPRSHAEAPTTRRAPPGTRAPAARAPARSSTRADASAGAVTSPKTPPATSATPSASVQYRGAAGDTPSRGRCNARAASSATAGSAGSE